MTKDPIQSEYETRSVDHGYTLCQGRANFLDHGHMHYLGRETSYLKSESQERIRMLDYMRRDQNCDAEFSQDKLIELIRAENECMRSRAHKARAPDSDEEAM